ncbi:MAG: hypothetical protein PVI81_08110 [Anaerolineales bacterium]
MREDFDRYWRDKLSNQIEAAVGSDVRDEIIRPDPEAENKSVIQWTRAVMVRLEDSLDAPLCQQIMTDCACHYPSEQLEPLRSLYQRSGDLKQIHKALQQQFETFMREALELDEDQIADIVERGWGAAGVLNGDTIIATKIPKSGYLKEYLSEPDPDLRRSKYCHCPRVRDAVEAGEELPQLYCYCGAGFYKHMWETILGAPVEVELLESVLSGGEVCKVAIKIPGKR